MDLSNRQMEIITGSLLGDGCLSEINSKNKGKYKKEVVNSRFSETHGEKQSDWLQWKRDQLVPVQSGYSECFVTARKVAADGVIANDYTRKYKQCRTQTIRYPIFTTLEKQWYARNEDGTYKKSNRGRRIKCIPADIKLTPLIVAVWFLDDGYNHQSRKSCSILTLAFTYEEVHFLNNQIREMGFESIVSKGQKEGQFYITVGAKSYLDFLAMIKVTLPDAPECMKYKFDTSKYKLTSKYTKHGLDDELAAKIMDDAEQKIPQKQIAEKYNIPFRVVNDLLKGRRSYKPNFIGSVNYRSTTGVPGVRWNKDHTRLLVNIALPKGNGKYFTCHLGTYQDKNMAAIVSNEARNMRSKGIADVELYKQMYKYYLRNNVSPSIS